MAKIKGTYTKTTTKQYVKKGSSPANNKCPVCGKFMKKG